MGIAQVHEESPTVATGDRYAFSLPETCAFTTLKMTKVRELVRTGELPSIRVGRRVLIPKAALVGWLEERISAGQRAA